MKGTVVTWQGNKSMGFILGEDGNEYFLHESEMTGTKKVKRGSIVEFDAVDTGKEHLRAVNVRKIGHGTHHPFIRDLERIEELIETCVSNKHPDKQYRLRDIQMMKNYFICKLEV